MVLRGLELALAFRKYLGALGVATFVSVLKHVPYLW